MQTNDYKLSLPTAILININIMLGAGIFINTSTLAQRTEALGGLMYIFVGLLMLPLILSIAQLLRLHPLGGFYAFGQKELNPMMGFLSTWCYFMAKLASCTLMIHVSVMLVQHIFPFLMQVETLLLDGIVVSIFTILNLMNIKAGGLIQKLFMGFKTFPIFFAIFSGIFLLQEENFNPVHFKWDGVYPSLPIVIYAAVGFEAACSMSGKIKDSQKNAPLAVLISFFSVILIAALYQAIFYGSLGNSLSNCMGHCETFPALVQKVFGSTVFARKFEGILHLALASSTLGAAYGIIFSNSWNLHTLAENQHLWFSKFFAKCNRNLIPFACVIVEGIVCLIYLAVSRGSLIPLQQIGAFGCVIAYTISVVALLRGKQNRSEISISRCVPILGLFSCTILIVACVHSFFINGMNSLIVYFFMIVAGLYMFAMKSKLTKEMPGSDARSAEKLS